MLHHLDHILAARAAEEWMGFGVFAVAVVVVVVGWVATTPFTLRRPVVQRVEYALIGPAQRLFEHVDAEPGRVHRQGYLGLFLAQRKVFGDRQVQGVVQRKCR